MNDLAEMRQPIKILWQGLTGFDTNLFKDK